MSSCEAGRGERGGTVPAVSMDTPGAQRGAIREISAQPQPARLTWARPGSPPGLLGVFRELRECAGLRGFGARCSPLLVQAGIRLGNAARQSPPSFLRTSCLSHVVEKSFPNTSIPFTRWRSSTEFTQKVGKWRFTSFPVCSRPSCRCWRERFDPSGMAADPMTRQLFWVQLHLGLNPFPNQELPKGRAQGRALSQFLRKLRAAFCLRRGSGTGL